MRCADEATRAADDLRSYAAKRDAYLAAREAAKASGEPLETPPAFVSSLRPSRAPARLQSLRAAPPPPPSPSSLPELARSPSPRRRNAPVSKPKHLKERRSLSPGKKRRPPPSPVVDPERSPEPAFEPLVIEEAAPPSKVQLHYLDATDDARSLSLAVAVPNTWHEKPAARLLNVFRKAYVKRAGSTLPEQLELRLLDGGMATGTVRDALLAGGGGLQVC